MAAIRVLFSLFFVVSASLAASVPITGRIIGGQHATPGQFPYMVSMQRRDPSNNYAHHCGGAIISDRIVLTAAHCCPITTSKDFRILARAHKQHDDPNGQAYEIKRSIRHENFSLSTMANDLGIVELVKPIKFNEFVAPIELGREFMAGDEVSVISGWGSSEVMHFAIDTRSVLFQKKNMILNFQDDARVLKFVQLNTISNMDCRRAFADLNVPIFNNGTLCAASDKRATGICSGDSGGPLVHNNKLIGVASWAKGCAEGYPDGFTRVSEYLSWIGMYLKN